jgi:hypothetical protein
MGKTKPGIIVLSRDDADSFDWLSDGWNEASMSHTDHAQGLVRKARKAIEAASDVPDAIKRLQAAGFDVRRQ